MRVATKFCAIQSYGEPLDVANFAELEYEALDEAPGWSGDDRICKKHLMGLWS